MGLYVRIADSDMDVFGALVGFDAALHPHHARSEEEFHTEQIFRLHFSS